MRNVIRPFMLLLPFVLTFATEPIFAQPTPSEAEQVQARPASGPKTDARPTSGVLKLEELSSTDVEKLDKAKSVFVLTFGNLEVHGPALPVGSDYFQAISVRDGMVAKLHSAHPDYNFVTMPVVPLGQGGAEELVGEPDHIGTFHVRFETLRNVAIDLAASVARKGFKHILLLHAHGGPLHNVAFTEASAFVSQKYHTNMVNITSLVFGEEYFNPAIITKYLGEGWRAKLGFEGHAGAAETSMNLALRPDLVHREYQNLAPFLALGVKDFKNSGWTGYWGDPSKASEAMGKELFADVVQRTYRLAERSLAGEDLSKLLTHPDTMPPPFLEMIKPIKQGVLDSDEREAAEIKAWLQTREAAKGH
jgi:creatinine amidohydrolase/Fe(II)-dependent formamide hydrolase-like protein